MHVATEIANDGDDRHELTVRAELSGPMVLSKHQATRSS